MALIRLPQRFCHCGELLKRRPGEQGRNWLKRKTCDKPKCAEELRSNSKKRAVVCFCGKNTDSVNPFCCWEHRLIYMKCANWKIEPSISGYESYRKKLMREQKEIDAQYW